MPAPGMHSGDATDEALNLSMSATALPLYEAVIEFIASEIDPITEEFFALGDGRSDRWQFADGQLELLDGAKAKARDAGLWNFFLPDAETGEGLSNLDYAYIAAELGKNPLAAECLNCSAPDTGNMEVLERVGTLEQKERWLQPLLNGEIRSAFAMTEPDVASSDAKNVATVAELDGDEWLINGEKFYISGAGDPRCKIMIVMVRTSPDAPPHRQQSQILVPMDTPGVEIVGPMHVFGQDDAPHGHMHLRFTDVRVPAANMLLGEGRGFEISQLRLGPGRIEIEAMRLMVLRAARAMDLTGNAEARIWVSAVKAMVPVRVCEIIDEAIQIHGAAGISQWTPLASMYAAQRTLPLRGRPGALGRPGHRPVRGLFRALIGLIPARDRTHPTTGPPVFDGPRSDRSGGVGVDAVRGAGLGWTRCPPS